MSLVPRPLSLTVNGQAVGPMDVPEGMPMIDFLHEYLNLTGSRLGCGIGECRACTVIVDGPETKGCRRKRAASQSGRPLLSACGEFSGQIGCANLLASARILA